jgi:multidrug efflux system outer membrane protein
MKYFAMKYRTPLRRPPASLRTSLASAVVAAVLASGCAHIPADSNPLAEKDIAQARLPADIGLTTDAWPQAQWWTRYQDAQLNELVTRALQGAPSLEVAATRVSSAQAALRYEAADGGNDIAFKASTNRQRYSGNGLLPPPIGGSYINETNVQLGVSHDFDWWGKRRAAIAASLGTLRASRAEYAQAAQTLAAAVAQSYFNWQALQARIAKLDQLRAVQRGLIADKAKRIAHGLAVADEQRAAEVARDQLDAEYNGLQTQALREREALRALVGADDTALATLSPHALPSTSAGLPSALGIELLARRPDLQAARARVEASLSRIESAQAAFYPDINLNAFVGLDSLSLEKLLQASSRTLFVGPTLTLPLFNSGRLQARLEGARSQRNEAIADYNESVVDAVREVAQAGASVQGLSRQVEAQTRAGVAARAMQRSTRLRFDHGLVDTSSLLNAEQAVLQQDQLALQLQAQQVQAELALIKALGGGFGAEAAPQSPAASAGTTAADTHSASQQTE